MSIGDGFDAVLQVACGTLLACLALVMPFVWLGGKGVHPIRAVLGLLGLQPWTGRLLLCALLCLGVYVGGSKVDSSPRQDAPAVQRVAPAPGASILETFNTWDYGDAGFFPPWTNAVTNACVTGISPGTTSDFLRVAWPERAAWPAGALGWFEFFGCRDLAAGLWTFLGTSPVPLGGREMVVEVPRAMLPGGPVRTAFYTFGFFVDSDGDDLSDLYETLVSGTLPDVRDTDGDMQEDGLEVLYGTCPTNPLSFFAPYALACDFDGDGLENSFDPEPEVPGPDAHGANEVWYNAVCSNVFTAVHTADGVALSPRTTSVNTDAYFFVDVALGDGAGAVEPVYFVADGPSRLGNPVLIPFYGETNRVPLLVGVEYCVTSPAPFSISVVNEMYWELDEIPGGYRVRVPVSVLREDPDGSPVPVRPEPGFDERLRGTLLHDGACCWRAASGLACYGGDSFCFCGGCTNRTWYVYEEYALDLGESTCGCDHDPPGEEWTEYGAGASVAFSKSAVIFEDPYQNEPGWLVEREPTRTVLTVALAGGRFGGYLVTDLENIDRLATLDGNPVDLPAILSVLPGETVTRTFQCRGVLPSGSLGDIRVGGVFMENMSGRAFRIEASATSVRLELQAVYEAPENVTCTNRHVFGVGEKVRFVVQPASSEIKLRAVKGDRADHDTVYDSFEGTEEVSALEPRVYTCPISAGYMPDVFLELYDVFYAPSLSLVEPSEVVTVDASWDEVCFPSGQVGEAGLRTENRIGPMWVSFQGIAVSEIPCTGEDAIPPTGYFTNLVNGLVHGVDQGAGTAHWIRANNHWTVDGAYSRQSAGANWCPGSLVWKIPIGWHRKASYMSDLQRQNIESPDYEAYNDATSRPLLIGGARDVYFQTREIHPDGTFENSKFGHSLSRGTMCRIILDGRTIQWFRIH